MHFKKLTALMLRYPSLFTILAVFITVMFLSLSALTGIFSHNRMVQNEKLKALGDLGVIRANLEGALNSRLLLGKGLVSYASLKPEMSERDFLSYAEDLVEKDPMIRNVSVLKGTTIIYAYPIETNQKAIGVDLAAVAEQRASVLDAIQTQRIVVVSHVDLVQGGIATVSRMPVFLKRGKEKVYWGQISMVLMQDVLFREAKLYNGSFGLKFSLQEKNSDNADGEYLFGSPSLESRDPVELDVIFPYGRWHLSAVPEKGWGYSDSLSIKYVLAGSLVSVAMGILLYFVMSSIRRIHQLESILPICSSCKKIKTEEGRWNSVESYFTSASNITFSHSLCPDCAEKLYGKAPWNKKK